MKKFFAIAAMVIACFSSANAQQAKGTLTITPKAGMTVSNLTHEGNALKNKVGFAAGAELTYQCSDRFALSLGGFYSQQGCEYKEDGEKATLSMDYINVPILANFYVCKGLCIKCGVQPGFKVSSKLSADGESYDTEDITKALGCQGINSFDLALPVGLSYEFDNGLMLDARWNVGVLKSFKDADSDKSWNETFMMTVGYKF